MNNSLQRLIDKTIDQHLITKEVGKKAQKVRVVGECYQIGEVDRLGDAQSI